MARSQVYDVYLEKGGGERSNASLWDKKNNRPFTYSTKGEKALIMKKLGVTEAGDRVRGAR